jgi:hypothetical protein
MLRALIIDESAKAKAARVIAHAEKNHYFLGKTTTPPGDDERFVAHLNDYRAVFSFTHSDGTIFRHLSISVPARGRFPHQAAAFTIADLFGFTGWDHQTIDKLPEGWIGVTHEDCLVLAQEIANA